MPCRATREEVSADGGEEAWRQAEEHVAAHDARSFEGAPVEVDPLESALCPEAWRVSASLSLEYQTWSEVAEADILLRKGFDSYEVCRVSSRAQPLRLLEVSGRQSGSP